MTNALPVQVENPSIMVNFDRACAHYVPIVSTLTALVNVFIKAAVLPFLSEEKIASSRYFTYVSEMSIERCVLMLVPILGQAYAWAFPYYVSSELLQKAKSDVHIMRYAGKNRLESEEFMLKAIRENVHCAAYLPSVLSTSQEFMLKAFEVSAACGKYFPKVLKESKEFIKEAIKINPWAFEYADDTLQTDYSFYRELIAIDKAIQGIEYQCAKEKFRPSLYY